MVEKNLVLTAWYLAVTAAAAGAYYYFVKRILETGAQYEIHFSVTRKDERKDKWTMPPGGAAVEMPASITGSGNSSLKYSVCEAVKALGRRLQKR